MTENDRAAESNPSRSYSFTAVLGRIGPLTVEMADAIFAAGCDDSTPSSSGEVVRVAFDREAESLGDAVGSAIRDLERAGYRVAAIEIEPEDEDE